jgi:hypothetical protein
VRRHLLAGRGHAVLKSFQPVFDKPDLLVIDKPDLLVFDKTGFTCFSPNQITFFNKPDWPLF